MTYQIKADAETVRRLLSELQAAYDENEQQAKELAALRAMFLTNVPPDALTFTRRTVPQFDGA